MSAARRLVRPATWEHLPELVEFAAQGVRGAREPGGAGAGGPAAAAAAEAEAAAAAAALHDIRLAVSEVCANVVEHGYAGTPGGTIAIETAATPERFVVRIEDDAPIFDPATRPPPDTHSDWEHRQVGKVGWHLVYSVMDEVRHEARGERGNVVILAKRIGPATAREERE